MPKAKKFIDRKSAVTFNLVHRSQRDPLAADDSAPQRVLVPVHAQPSSKTEKQPELSVEQRRVEQQKFGIFFDDDYNYLQHLRDTKEVTMLLAPKASHKRKDKSEAAGPGERLQLPSSVFASEVEEDVGLLNKAAPQGLRLDLDPEVVAALDEDYDFDDPDNQLEDNFMELAMGDGSEECSGEEEESEDGSDKSFASDQEYSSDDDDSQGSGGGRAPRDKFAAEETKSRFSQYSMSSSVMRRNEGLSLLDHRFEKMFAEYDDTELGALDCEEIEGALPDTHDMLLRAADEFRQQRGEYRPDKGREIARMHRLQEIAEEESSEEELVRLEVAEKEKWDCESILSTYSNLYNHPKIIDEPKKPQKIKINAKTGIPMDTLHNDTTKLTAKSLARLDAEHRAGDSDENTHAESILSTLSVLSLRPKDESPEEKRERKRLLKEYRKERRVERRANRDAFKEEKKRQEKIMLNNRNNIQGNRIL